jgi:nucleoside-diphosphate-sugar epimerase
MLAERLVLMSNCQNFKTVALRPHLIWGPGDPHLLPRLIEKAKKGRLWLFSGGPYIVDATFVDNAAKAHVLALEKLASGAPVGGEAFFIAQGQPLNLNELINKLLKAVGLPEVKRFLPKELGLLTANTVEKTWRLLSLQSEPPVTLFAAKQLSTSHWYALEKAKNLLGYQPLVNLDEGLNILSRHYKSLNN